MFEVRGGGLVGRVVTQAAPIFWCMRGLENECLNRPTADGNKKIGAQKKGATLLGYWGLMGRSFSQHVFGSWGYC